ncbi:MAG: nucleotidyltransferase [Sphingobacteriaceae bacterium]|nr:MAG: nucleotidyltransferase [Sphingobacteriaceae bacterium]
MSDKDIRWKQRFQNFEKAFFRLKEALQIEDLNELERNGVIQRFEFTLELCWKTLKDFLEAEGFQFKPTPKETIRQAFNSELITDADVLIDALDIRNDLSHDYSGEKFESSEDQIRERIYPAIEKVYVFFATKVNNNQ